MRTFYIAFTQSRPIAPIIIAVVALSFATAALADIVAGASSTGISDHVTYTNLTLNTPTSVSSGDLMLASIVATGGSALGITPPSGWTQIQRTDNDVNVTLVTYWKIAGASEPSNYSWTINTQTRAVGGITRYSGVDTTNPIDVSSGNTGFSSSATSTAVTTTGANEEVVAVFATDVNKTLGTTTGMTQEYTQTHTTLGPTIAANDTLQVSAGTSGSNSSSIDPHAARYWAAQQIALRRPTTPPSVNGSVTTNAVQCVVTTSTAFSHTVSTGNNQVLVVTAGSAYQNDTSATYDGIAMTQGNATGLGTEEAYGYWYLVNPPQGTHDVVINFPLGSNDTGYNCRQYAAITIQDANQTTPIGTDGHVGGNGGNPSISVTTSEANDFVLYFLDYDDRTTNLIYTPNDASLYWVNNDSTGNTLGNRGAVHTQTAAGTISVGGTATGSGPWDLVAVPIRPAN
jgi:hypothetical protein